ncbi:hypothetical protein J2Y38_000918 [Flavobacterium sp. 2755]|nr:hypothetical protein [Flavobacterium sp. 2755]
MESNLFYCVFFALFSFGSYKFHKYWLKNSKNEFYVKEGHRLDKIKHWGIILVSAFCSVICFLKFVFGLS